MSIPNDPQNPYGGEQPQDPAQPPYGAPQPPYGAPQPPAYGTPAPPPYGAPQQPPAAPQYPGYPSASPYPAAPQYGGPGYAGGNPTAKNSLGVWSLVLGILSIICLGFLAGIPAIILGNSAKKAVARGEANNGSLATAGVVLGWIGIVLSIIGIIVSVSRN